jgi:hypothetical protein
MVEPDLDPDTGRPSEFDGASTFYLWGAVFTTIEGKSPVDLAQTLAHETGHLLLFGSMLGRPLVENEDDERYDSPLRRDPRPMEGVVHAAYVMDRHLHVVAMLRDPRDVIVSRHRNDPQRYWAPLRFWKRHALVIRRLRHHRRFILVRYEDLVRTPDAVQEALVARMPFLKQRARFSDFHKLARPSAKSVAAMGSVRPIDSASIGNWRNHLARVAGQIAIHGSISEELIAFGYEPDQSWLAALKGVSPDLTPSHWPESIARPIWRTGYTRYLEAAKIAAARVVGSPVV